MGTVIESSIRRVVDENLTDPEFVLIVATYLKNLRKGLYEKWFTDTVFQKWDAHDEIDLYDAYAFGIVHQMACTAKVVIARVFLGDLPSKDCDIEGMNNKLSKLSLYKGRFSAKFVGGTQDSDGVFFVNKPTELDMIHKQTNERVTRNVKGDFPLEVGYTSAAKTTQYMRDGSGRLARWPYGSDTIILMQSLELSMISYG